MSEITKNIYLGDARDSANEVWLKEAGITHIVNAAIQLPNFFPSDFDYLRLDLYDDEQQRLGSSLDKAYIFIKKAINKDKKVLIHCVAGISRSASVVIYYLMKEYEWDCQEAYDFVKKRRFQIQPNSSFEDELSQFC